MAPLDVDFDGKVHLVGLVCLTQSSLNTRRASKVTVTLVWRCDEKLDEGWLLFTHVLGPAGADGAQPRRRRARSVRDGVAGQPLSPSRWEPGKFYRDELSFTVPAEARRRFSSSRPASSARARASPSPARAQRQESRAMVVRLATGARHPAAEVERARRRSPAGRRWSITDRWQARRGGVGTRGDDGSLR